MLMTLKRSCTKVHCHERAFVFQLYFKMNCLSCAAQVPYYSPFNFFFLFVFHLLRLMNGATHHEEENALFSSPTQKYVEGCENKIFIFTL